MSLYARRSPTVLAGTSGSTRHTCHGYGVGAQLPRMQHRRRIDTTTPGRLIGFLACVFGVGGVVVQAVMASLAESSRLMEGRSVLLTTLSEVFK